MGYLSAARLIRMPPGQTVVIKDSQAGFAAGRAPDRVSGVGPVHAWSNGKPAYRCRHGYTSATSPGPGRPKNLYVREDKILPRLAALAILHARDQHAKHSDARVTAPACAAELIDRLRVSGVGLIYDPATKAVRTSTTDSLAVTVG